MVNKGSRSIFAALLGGWILSAGALTAQVNAGPAVLPEGVTKVPVVFSGGHETVPSDMGRPVILIASALGVKPEVFREAFSKVHPAEGGKAPEESQVRQNKAVLMSALSPYGITNERLDEVSNYYRYVKQRGELWPVKAAVAQALIKDGKVIGFEIVNPGSGYSSQPTVEIPSLKKGMFSAVVQIDYGKDFKTNGSVSAILLKPEPELKSP